MYKISLPILGFEEVTRTQINLVDEYFATLTLSDNHKINIVNITFLKNTSFDFNIDDETLRKLHINLRSDFDIYFSIVIQEPLENSIVNLTAPILINHKNRLLGQFVIKDKIPKLFTTLKVFNS